MTNDPEIQRQYQEAMINMGKEYPENYKGPKAGQSDDEEWLAVREYDAYMYIIYGTWSYSDFDCWLVARDRHHYKLGGDAAVTAPKPTTARRQAETPIRYAEK